MDRCCCSTRFLAHRTSLLTSGRLTFFHSLPLLPSSPVFCRRVAAVTAALRSSKTIASLSSSSSSPPPHTAFSCLFQSSHQSVRMMAALDVQIGVGSGSVRQQVAKLVKESLNATVPEVADVEPLVSACNNAKNGDYQCNNAMGIWAKIKGTCTKSS
jgi:predicted DNA-binding protein